MAPVLNPSLACVLFFNARFARSPDSLRSLSRTATREAQQAAFQIVLVGRAEVHLLDAIPIVDSSKVAAQPPKFCSFVLSVRNIDAVFEVGVCDMKSVRRGAEFV